MWPARQKELPTSVLAYKVKNTSDVIININKVKNTSDVIININKVKNTSDVIINMNISN